MCKYLHKCYYLQNRVGRMSRRSNRQTANRHQKTHSCLRRHSFKSEHKKFLYPLSKQCISPNYRFINNFFPFSTSPPSFQSYVDHSTCQLYSAYILSFLPLLYASKNDTLEIPHKGFIKCKKIHILQVWSAVMASAVH